jgi:hypothetical protein
MTKLQSIRKECTKQYIRQLKKDCPYIPTKNLEIVFAKKTYIECQQWLILQYNLKQIQALYS